MNKTDVVFPQEFHVFVFTTDWQVTVLECRFGMYFWMKIILRGAPTGVPEIKIGCPLMKSLEKMKVVNNVRNKTKKETKNSQRNFSVGWNQKYADPGENLWRGARLRFRVRGFHCWSRTQRPSSRKGSWQKKQNFVISAQLPLILLQFVCMKLIRYNIVLIARSNFGSSILAPPRAPPATLLHYRMRVQT